MAHTFFDSRYQRAAFVISLIVGFIGVLGTIGYFAGVPVLASWGRTLTPMLPLSAAALMGLGFFTALYTALPEDAIGRWFLAGAGIATALFGFESVTALAQQWSLNDLLLAWTSDPRHFPAGPMPPLSAVTFVILGTATAALALPPGSRPTMLIVTAANIGGIAGSVVLLGYLYGAGLLYGSGMRPVALPVAIGIVAHSLSLLCLEGRNHLPLNLLHGHRARARLLRVFLPVVAVVLIVDGVLARFLPRESAENVGAALSVLIFTATNILIVYIATRMSGDSIDRAEAEQKDAERKVEAARHMFESLFDSAPGAIVAVDTTGTIVRVNAETERKFGYRREELVGQPLEILIPERFSKTHKGHTARYMQQPHVRPMGSGYELFGRRKDGSEFPVDIMLGPLKTESGTLILSIVYDITERKKAQNEIQALNKELEKRIKDLEVLNNELESFSYSVSHDLRAPLRGIYGFAQVLNEDYGDKLDAEGKRVLGVIQDNAKRMGQLIDDLLAFSRLGRQSSSLSLVDMRELFKGVFDELLAANPDRRIEFHLAALPPAMVDRAMMRQVIVNLLANAVKFTRQSDPAKIEVGAGEQGDEVVYHIRDNGVGFDMQYAAKLFGVFQRLHRQQDFEGTGVGLAIVQRVIHRHGGRIWAESTPGQGATFFFTLPRVHEAERYSV